MDDNFAQHSETRLVCYRDVRCWIHDADLLLFRRRAVSSDRSAGWLGRLHPLRRLRELSATMITVAGRGLHSHAAKAAWWDEDLFCVEVRGAGGRAVTLSSQVARFPGCIDVFRANPRGRWPEFNRAAASRYMRRLCGCDYGYRGLAAAALLHLPGIRWFVRAEIDDQAIARRPPFCSHACAMADRLGGGVDPVPHLADRLTEPADLARSPFYEYRFTLLP